MASPGPRQYDEMRVPSPQQEWLRS
jgi:hypothetical protein